MSKYPALLKQLDRYSGKGHTNEDIRNAALAIRELEVTVKEWETGALVLGWRETRSHKRGKQHD